VIFCFGGAGSAGAAEESGSDPVSESSSVSEAGRFELDACEGSWKTLSEEGRAAVLASAVVDALALPLDLLLLDDCFFYTVSCGQGCHMGSDAQRYVTRETTGRSERDAARIDREPDSPLQKAGGRRQSAACRSGRRLL
jgi:hypothetical protein